MSKHLRVLTLLLTILAAAPLYAQRTTPPAGLRAAFYRGQDFSGTPLLTRIDATIDFNWDYEGPAPGLPQEYYCVRWTGALRAPATGTYTFHITTDDGMRVWLGNKQLFNEWRPQVPSTFSTRVKLTAGEFYSLRVEYYQLRFQAQARLTWEPPNLDRRQASSLFGLLGSEPQPIPPQVLFARVPPPAPPPRALPRPSPVALPRPVAPPAPAPPAPRPAALPIPRSAIIPATPLPPPRETPITPPPKPAPPTTADLGKLAKGTTLEVKNLFFEQSRATLLPTSEPAIAQLAAALAQNPRVALEIAGHTDNVGDSVANQRLSEERARRVRALLITRGIDSTRLKAVGYGGTRLVTNSREPLKRARNRRVEITVR